MAAAMAEIRKPLEIIIDGDKPLKSPAKHQIGGDSPWIRIMELDPYRCWTTCRGCRRNPDGCRNLFFFSPGSRSISLFFFFLNEMWATLPTSDFPKSSVIRVIFTATAEALSLVQRLSQKAAQEAVRGERRMGREDDERYAVFVESLFLNKTYTVSLLWNNIVDGSVGMYKPGAQLMIGFTIQTWAIAEA